MLSQNREMRKTRQRLRDSAMGDAMKYFSSTEVNDVHFRVIHISNTL